MEYNSKLDIYFNKSPTRKSNANKIIIPRIGYLKNTKYGSVWVVDWEYASGYLYGRYELQKARCFNSLMDFSLKGFDSSLATVIDTETTGIVGGTGKYAFIIGSGFWQDSKFIIRQYIMRDFNEESAQLSAFAADLTDNLISYNGKCFDLPLLQNRFRLHRLDPPFNDCPHLDMLFPCRRIWKRNLSSFKLIAIEKEILGYARTDDIPSYQIASIFFDYLQNRDETLLYPILHHNRDDILSLYMITAVASSIIKDNIDYTGNDDDLILSLAEICFNNKEYHLATNLLEKIKQDFASEKTFLEAIRLKAFAFKKLRKWEKAVETFSCLDKLKSQSDSAIELAKLYEHRLKDPQKALEIVNKIERLLQFKACKGNDAYSQVKLLLHRKERLLIKISRLLQK